MARTRSIPRLMIPSAILTWALLGAPAGAATAGGRVQAVDQRTLALKTFSDRVRGYVELRNRVDRELHPLVPTGDASELEAHRRALAQAIQRARSKAQPGDLFSPFVAAVFRSVIKDHFRNRPREDFYAIVREIPRSVRLDINAPYPSSVPLATFPPLLLAELPPLPDEVAYGLVGRALILRDVEADLVVDLINKALPSKP